MATFFQLALLFIIGGFFGWIIETINRSFHSKKFVNAGFLKGPYLPIYGFGLIIVYSICPLNSSLFVKIILFLSATTLLELVAGLFLEKGFHLKLWNYQGCILNYRGIISLSHTFYWLLLSITFYFLIFQHLKILFSLQFLEIPAKIIISIVLIDAFVRFYKILKNHKKKK